MFFFYIYIFNCVCALFIFFISASRITMNERKKKGYYCFYHVLMIAYCDATCVEYASISSPWRMGNLHDFEHLF